MCIFIAVGSLCCLLTCRQGVGVCLYVWGLLIEPDMCSYVTSYSKRYLKSVSTLSYSQALL